MMLPNHVISSYDRIRDKSRDDIAGSNPTVRQTFFGNPINTKNLKNYKTRLVKMPIRSSFVGCFANIITNIFNSNFINDQSSIIVREINSIDIATDFFVINKPFYDWWWMRFNIAK